MREDRNTSPQGRPAGALQRVAAKPAQALAHVDLHTLLTELWARLTSREELGWNGPTVMLGDAVAERLASTLDFHENRFSVTRIRDMFSALYRRLDEPRATIQGATFLALGCGSANPLGLSMLMCALGARHAVGIDLDPVADAARAARGMVRVVQSLLLDPRTICVDHAITREQIIANIDGIDLAGLQRGDPGALGARFGYHNASAADMPLPDGSVDIVVSNSFFEHLPDVPAVLRELHRVTSPGAYSTHAIDGVDHRWYRDGSLHELAFLREPGPGLLRGTNRIRPLEFAALFEGHGFEVQQIRPTFRVALSDEQIAGFAPPWNSMPREVLEVTRATFVTRKPA
jgi:SAM-dependent methyltransferase